MRLLCPQDQNISACSTIYGLSTHNNNKEYAICQVFISWNMDRHSVIDGFDFFTYCSPAGGGAHPWTGDLCRWELGVVWCVWPGLSLAGKKKETALVKPSLSLMGDTELESVTSTVE